MRILKFCDIYINNSYEVVDEDSFFKAILEKKFDVLVISFNYYKEFLQIKQYFNGIVIFFVDYCDSFSYKKVLSVGDYCFDNLDKLYIRLEYIRKKVLRLNGGIFKYKEFIFNFNTNNLYKNSEIISASLAEKELLKSLIKSRDIFLSKNSIIEECEHIESVDSIKVLISRLRKIGFDIINKKNLGYKLVIDK